MSLKSRHAKAIAGLLPPVSYDPNGRWLMLSLEAEGRTLDRVADSAAQLTAAVDVESGIFIDDWERVCGLQTNATKPLETRIALVIAKLNQLGGLSIPYLTEMAARIGYQIKIHELEPFRAGINRCGDRLWDESVKWLICVDLNSPEDATGYEAVPIIQEPTLSALLDELKPAFTHIWVRDYGAMTK